MRFSLLAVAAWSLAGGLIAGCDATAPAPDPEGRPGTVPSSLIAFRRERDLYVVLPNGSGLRLVAQGRPPSRSGNLAFFDPKWSPDGQRLAYRRMEGEDPGRMTLEISRWDGSEPHAVSEAGAYIPEVAWAPGGDRLAYTQVSGEPGSSEFYGGSFLYTVRPDGSDQRAITTTASIPPGRASLACPSWSPDGSRIAFVDRLNGLWTADAAGTNQRLVFSGAVTCARWSPAGSHLAFVLDQNIETGGLDPRSEIFLINPDGMEPRRLTEPPNSDDLPVWSPDGRSLAFQRARGGVVSLYQVRTDATEAVLVVSPIGIGLQMTWSPDGRRLALVSGFSGERHIQVVNSDGTGLRQLTPGVGDEYEPDWH